MYYIPAGKHEGSPTFIIFTLIDRMMLFNQKFDEELSKYKDKLNEAKPDILYNRASTVQKLGVSQKQHEILHGS